MLRVKVTREATEEEQIFDNIFGGRADLATPGGYEGGTGLRQRFGGRADLATPGGYEGRAGPRESMQSNDVGLRV